MTINFRSVRGEGTSTGISDKGPVLAMVMTWAAVVYATLTLLYWFCDSGYNYNWVLFFVLWTYAPVVSYQIRRWWSRVVPLWSRVVARSDLKKWFITRSKLDEFRIKRWCTVSSVQGIVLDSFKTNAHKNTVFRPQPLLANPGKLIKLFARF